MFYADLLLRHPTGPAGSRLRGGGAASQSAAVAAAPQAPQKYS